MKWSFPHGLERWKEALGRYQMILLVLAAGLVLMLLPSGGGQADRSVEPFQDTSEENEFDLEEFEAKLAQTLSQIEGAGEAKVILTLKSSGRQILAQDIERDGERTVTSAVTLGKGSSTQEVVALQTLSPQFQGALVVCPGGDDPDVRLQLSQAVAALTGLGSDRISICKSTGTY